MLAFLETVCGSAAPIIAMNRSPAVGDQPFNAVHHRQQCLVVSIAA